MMFPCLSAAHDKSCLWDSHRVLLSNPWLSVNRGTWCKVVGHLEWRKEEVFLNLILCWSSSVHLLLWVVLWVVLSVLLYEPHGKSHCKSLVLWASRTVSRVLWVVCCERRMVGCTVDLSQLFNAFATFVFRAWVRYALWALERRFRWGVKASAALQVILQVQPHITSVLSTVLDTRVRYQ